MDETAEKAGLLQLLNQIQSQYGLLVLMLVVIIVFGCSIFWRLIWRVWSGALSAKESEIARLERERDRYQAVVFDRLRASKALDPREREAACPDRCRR
jgi:hypothetical protein